VQAVGFLTNNCCKACVKQRRPETRSQKGMRNSVSAAHSHFVVLRLPKFLSQMQTNSRARLWTMNSGRKLKTKVTGGFRLETYKPGGAKETDEVVETKDGDLKRPLLINGKPTQGEEANRRLEQLARNQDQLQKSLNDNDDAAHSQSLLKVLPDAFIYT